VADDERPQVGVEVGAVQRDRVCPMFCVRSGVTDTAA